MEYVRFAMIKCSGRWSRVNSSTVGGSKVLEPRKGPGGLLRLVIDKEHAHATRYVIRHSLFMEFYNVY
jgi:hypothetical protein